MEKRDHHDIDFIVDLKGLNLIEYRLLPKLEETYRVILRKRTADSELETVEELLVRADHLIPSMDIEAQLMARIRNVALVNKKTSARGGTYWEATQIEAVPPSPPSAFWLDALVDPRIAKDWRVNLAESFYPDWFERHGRRKANVIWYSQMALFIAGQRLLPLLTFLDKMKKTFVR